MSKGKSVTRLLARVQVHPFVVDSARVSGLAEPGPDYTLNPKAKHRKSRQIHRPTPGETERSFAAQRSTVPCLSDVLLGYLRSEVFTLLPCTSIQIA